MLSHKFRYNAGATATLQYQLVCLAVTADLLTLWVLCLFGFLKKEKG